MHIRERNNKVMGKSAIKRGIIFKDAVPLSPISIHISMIPVYDQIDIQSL